MHRSTSPALALHPPTESHSTGPLNPSPSSAAEKTEVPCSSPGYSQGKCLMSTCRAHWFLPWPPLPIHAYADALLCTHFPRACHGDFLRYVMEARIASLVTDALAHMPTSAHHMPLLTCPCLLPTTHPCPHPHAHIHTLHPRLCPCSTPMAHASRHPRPCPPTTPMTSILQSWCCHPPTPPQCVQMMSANQR